MEREVLEFDVQFIGAGPAGLAGAIHLANLIEKHNASAAGSGATPIPETTIAVLEKAATVGAHGISGLVMDPRAMRELMPDYREQGCPIASDVASDDVLFLTEQGQFRLPYVPPMLDNHGNHIMSLGALVAWMAQKAEEKGVLVANEMPAGKPIVENGRSPRPPGTGLQKGKKPNSAAQCRQGRVWKPRRCSGDELAGAAPGFTGRMETAA